MDEDASSGKQYPTRSHRRWFRAVLALAGLLVVGLLAGIWVTREPAVIYAGQPLEVYLGDLVYPAGDPKYRSATNALHALGDAAFPVIIRTLARPVPWYAAALIRWGDRLSPRIRVKLNGQLKPYRTAQRRTGAGVALSLLGTNAAPIAGDVMRVFGQLDYQQRASLVQYLPPVGASLVPHLKPYLTTPDIKTRSLAAFVIHRLGPSSADAVKELIAGLNGADANHRRLVSETLGRMGSVVLPDVTNLLASSDGDLRLVAVQSLDHLFPRQREATSSLLVLLNDPSAEVRLESACLITRWWSMPIGDWRQRIEILPVGHPTREAFGDLLKDLETHEERLAEVLHEGLRHPNPTKRIQAATHLINAHRGSEQVIQCLRDLNASAGASRWGESITNLLKRVQEQELTHRYRQTNSHPDTVPTRRSPASPGPPPPGKLP